jgi:phosphoribosylformylglycinamidine synthase
VVAVEGADLERLLEVAQSHGVPAMEIGETGGDRLRLDTGGEVSEATVEELRQCWLTALPRALDL